MPPSRRARILHVFADGFMVADGRRLRCTLGRGGIRSDKREGDGATPVGLYPVRQLNYRRNRAGRPATALPARPIMRSHGWCDDPASPLYNRPVRLPFPASHERLWRDDRLYDAVISIGHNDRPAMPHMGSAVFVHVMSPEGAPTEGCVALAPGDMAWLLQRLGPGDISVFSRNGCKRVRIVARRAPTRPHARDRGQLHVRSPRRCSDRARRRYRGAE